MKHQKGFSVVVILAIIILVGLIISVGWYVWHQQTNEDSSRPSGDNTFVVPDQVNLFLEKSLESEGGLAVLELSVVAGGGCDNASDLQITQSRTETDLTVNIKGYDFTEGPGGAAACPAVLLESRTTIGLDLDWLGQGSEKTVVFTLAGKENEYRLARDENKITLTGVHTSNVISKHFLGETPSDRPQTLEIDL